MLYYIDGIFTDVSGERLYLEYSLKISKAPDNNIKALKTVLFEVIKRFVRTEKLDILFPIGTGNKGIDFEELLFQEANKLATPLNITVKKGYIRRYMMPDRIDRYKTISNAELYYQLNSDKEAECGHETA